MPIDIFEVPKGKSPYEVYERDYWTRPREICVVDEINPLDDDKVEIICGLHPKNEDWVRGLAKAYDFEVERFELKDKLGTFRKFVVRKNITE